MNEYVLTYKHKGDLIWLCQECISSAVKQEIWDMEVWQNIVVPWAEVK